ncbi:DUF4192 domain-containing protein [Actinomadura keratinilytica]|jgi:hypothetical protein|uniref:DUF4192 domain-containing protein n=1 Tax=Actinomadura keratinilytica TaxID=547461 RepID=A0ABP7ZHE3_9ACTN
MFLSSTPIVVRTAADAIALVPYLLGFVPSEDLVMVGLGGSLRTVAYRVDLPAAGDEDTVDAMAEHLARLARRNRIARALLVGYGPSERVVPVAAAVTGRVSACGVEVIDAFRVHEGRWWSLTCTGGCCPPEGRPYDPSTSVAAVDAVIRGLAALPDRAALAASVAAVTGPARRAVRKATAVWEQRYLRASRSDPAGTRHRMVTDGIPLVAELAERVRAQGPAPSDSEVARLGVLLTCLRVRDEAWIRIDGDDRSVLLRHVDFWRDVLRRVEEPYAAAPAGLLAYAAYISGDGALANVALDRARTADPGYSMAALLRDVLAAGLPPDQARLRITPEELADMYAATENRPAT